MYFLSCFLILAMAINKVIAAPLMCTMCTVAVASGLGIARLLGVSDLVVGVWFDGAATLVMSEWSVYFLSKKGVNNTVLKLLVFLSSYVLVIFPYVGKHPSIIFNDTKILLIDSFLFSVIVGSLVLYLSMRLYSYMKDRNNGHSHFPYEKVVLPIFLLLVTSLVFNIL